MSTKIKTSFNTETSAIQQIQQLQQIFNLMQFQEQMPQSPFKTKDEAYDSVGCGPHAAMYIFAH